MNRAEFRDWVRLKLGKVPARQATDVRNGTQTLLYPDANIGDPSPNDPWPSNAQLNQALNDSIDEINLLALPNMSAEPRVINVPGVTDTETTGAMQVSLQDHVGSDRTFDVTRINQAWVVVDDVQTRLDITTLDQYCKRNPTWFATGSTTGTPYIVWFSGYNAWLYPRCTTDFTFHYVAYEGLRYPINDTDIVGGLAQEEYSVLGWIMARNIASMAPNDQILESEWQKLNLKATELTGRLAANVGSRAGDNYQPNLTPAYDYRWPRNFRRRG